MKPIVKIGFLFQDILIILLGIKVHASSISGKGCTHGGRLTYIDILMYRHYIRVSYVI